MPSLSPDTARLAVTLFRLSLGAVGLGLLALAALPAVWFQHPGLPRTATGLRIGSDGWTPGAERVSWGLLTAILLVGAALRLYGLNTDLWLDEVATLSSYMRASLWENLYLYENANQHVLNSLLGHLSIGVFGEQAWAARLPAVLFGIGGVWALYYFARAATSEREALLATALLAVSYHHVWFSQNARGYTAMVFWVLVGTGLLLRALGQNRTRDWVLYVLAMVAGAWSLLNTVFLLAAHLPAYLALLVRWRAKWAEHGPITRRILTSQVAIGLGCALLYSLALASIITYFTVGSDEVRPDAERFDVVAAVLDGITSGIGWVGLLAVAAGFLFAAAGWFSYARQSPLVAALLALPAAFNVGAVLFLHFPAYPRSFLYVLPLGILAVVRGTVVLAGRAARLSPSEERQAKLRRALPVVLVGVMIAASSFMLLFNYRYPKQDYQGALAYVRAHQEPGDLVCAVGWAATAYREYHAPDLCFPASMTDLVEVERGGRPVWVLYSFSRDMRAYFPELNDYINNTFAPVEDFPGTLGDGTIYVVRKG